MHRAGLAAALNAQIVLLVATGLAAVANWWSRAVEHDAVERWSKPLTTILVIGLALSVALMGLAASLIARLLNRHRWIAYVGLAIILYVALHMIWRGILEVYPVVT